MNYDYFSHTACEYFPCHEGADPADFNCLFCFCPLYYRDGACPGNPSFLDNGVKDCSACTYPHKRAHYQDIMKLLGER